MVGVDPALLEIGARVVVSFADTGEGVSLVRFCPERADVRR